MLIITTEFLTKNLKPSPRSELTIKICINFTVGHVRYFHKREGHVGQPCLKEGFMQCGQGSLRGIWKINLSGAPLHIIWYIYPPIFVLYSLTQPALTTSLPALNTSPLPLHQAPCLPVPTTALFPLSTPTNTPFLFAKVIPCPSLHHILFLLLPTTPFPP